MKSSKLPKTAFVTSVFAAATFAASFVFGSAITTTLGPGTSGVVTIIITTILVVVGARVVERPWYFTVAVTLFTVFAIPTNLFGPPGLHKIGIGFATGITYDFVAFLARKSRFALPIAAAVATAVSIVLIFAILIYLDHPRKEFLGKFLIYIVPVYALLGFIGAALGNLIYDRRLSKLSVVLQLKK